MVDREQRSIMQKRLAALKIAYPLSTANNFARAAALRIDFGAHSYGYDAASKLTSATYPSSGPLSGLSETFSYDAVGNRTQDVSVSGYAYGANNQLTGSSVYSYSYDNNGNMTGRTRLADNASATFTYDSRNRMVTATTENGEIFTFTYDVMGRRLSKTVVHNGNTLSSDYYIYDGADIIAVTDANRTVKTVYTHGLSIDEHLMMKKDTTDYFMLTDGLGSVIALTDQSGTVVERTQYQSYGKPVFENAITGSTSAWSTTGNIYSYTGREWTAGMGMYYYRARYYDPNTGRFVQSDPIGFNGGDINLYAYAFNSPISIADPFGLMSISFNMYTLPFGPGGGFTIGRNPNNSWWFQVRGGVGIGGGFVYDPFATGPSRAAPSDFNMRVGLFGSTRGVAGPVSAGMGFENSALIQNTGGTGEKWQVSHYQNYDQPSLGIRPNLSGINASVAVGVQITIW